MSSIQLGIGPCPWPSLNKMKFSSFCFYVVDLLWRELNVIHCTLGSVTILPGINVTHHDICHMASISLLLWHGYGWTISPKQLWFPMERLFSVINCTLYIFSDIECCKTDFVSEFSFEMHHNLMVMIPTITTQPKELR